MTRPFTLATLGLVVFAANGGLLVLQLVAGRVLAPFVGSSLETWTAVIGVFLAGIAAGNWVGAGRRFANPSGRTLSFILLSGAVTAVWLVALPEWLHRSDWHTALPLGARIVALSALTCFPAGFALSLLTPLAVRIGTADVRTAGRVAGTTFALGTLGCLIGNYATGFWLIPSFTVDAIVYGVAGGLAALAVVALAIPAAPVPRSDSASAPLPDLTKPFAVVFTCGFAGMALELAGVRAMAQLVGVSLFTWTGVIGVMLAGTAAGNWLGGRIADAAHRRGADSARLGLSVCLIAAGSATAFIIGLFILSEGLWFKTWPVVSAVLAWSFSLFFLPMTLFGTVSPQVIRLAIPDAAHAGAVAGRVYAVSTLGALAGTFATGFVLIAELGMLRVLLLVTLLPVLASFLVARVWENKGLLYVVAIVGGVGVGGLFLFTPANTKIARETNYFTIQVKPAPDAALAARGVLILQLDRLIHSWVLPDDPTYMHYAHEQIQSDVLREQSERIAAPRVLVIGGGAYTFPRAARTLVPSCRVDVVEIDPGVTAVTYERLSLDPGLGIQSFHMDGRQFVSERAGPGSYDLITMDAVNDLSVPSHLLTKEFHDRVRTALTPAGVYLVSVIDQPDVAKVLPAVVHTLRETFTHVELLTPNEKWDPTKQAVFAVYAADVPFEEGRVRDAAARSTRDPRVAVGGGPTVAAVPWAFSHRPPAAEVERLLAANPPLVLTDRYAPVDWLMAEVYRRRSVEGTGKSRPAESSP